MLAQTILMPFEVHQRVYLRAPRWGSRAQGEPALRLADDLAAYRAGIRTNARCFRGRARSFRVAASAFCGPALPGDAEAEVLTSRRILTNARGGRPRALQLPALSIRRVCRTFSSQRFPFPEPTSKADRYSRRRAVKDLRLRAEGTRRPRCITATLRRLPGQSRCHG